MPLVKKLNLFEDDIKIIIFCMWNMQSDIELYTTT